MLYLRSTLGLFLGALIYLGWQQHRLLSTGRALPSIARAAFVAPRFSIADFVSLAVTSGEESSRASSSHPPRTVSHPISIRSPFALLCAQHCTLPFIWSAGHRRAVTRAQRDPCRHPAVRIFGLGPPCRFLTCRCDHRFMSKLLAKTSRIMSGCSRAIRATGSSWLQWINYAFSRR